MFGTVGRAQIKDENRDPFIEVLRKQGEVNVPGFRGMKVMFPENRPGEVVIAVWFDDAKTYWANAEDPAQHERYLEFRALLDSEPEWSDGEWHSFEART